MEERDVKTAKADSDNGKKTLDSAFAMIRKLQEKMEKMGVELKKQFGVDIGSARLTALLAIVLSCAAAAVLYAATTVWDVGYADGSAGTCNVSTASGAMTLTVDTIAATQITGVFTGKNVTTTTLISNVVLKVYGSNVEVVTGGALTLDNGASLTLTAGACTTQAITGTIATPYTNVFNSYGVLISHKP